MYRAAVCIQTAFRGYIMRRRYRCMKAAVIMIQTHFRGFLVRKKVEKVFF